MRGFLPICLLGVMSILLCRPAASQEMNLTQFLARVPPVKEIEEKVCHLKKTSCRGLVEALLQHKLTEQLPEHVAPDASDPVLAKTIAGCGTKENGPFTVQVTFNGALTLMTGDGPYVLYPLKQRNAAAPNGLTVIAPSEFRWEAPNDATPNDHHAVFLVTRGKKCEIRLLHDATVSIGAGYYRGIVTWNNQPFALAVSQLEAGSGTYFINVYALGPDELKARGSGLVIVQFQ